MKTNKQISASIMCVDNLLNIEKSIKELESMDIDMLHLDAMDNHFVENITFGPDIFNAIASRTNLICDYHLMLENPLNFIHRLYLKDGDIVTVHAEINQEILQNTLNYLIAKKIINRNLKIGIAINPETSIESLIELNILNKIDYILVMLIHPGFAGQEIIKGILNKPGYIRNYLNSIGKGHIMIGVDGGINHERANMLSKQGVDIFVGGTSGLFIKNNNLKDNVKNFKKSIEI